MCSCSTDHAGFADFCFPCIHVLHQLRPVRHVIRDGEDWIFTCGDADHFDEADWGYAHTVHLLDADDSIRELADLAPNGQAARYNARTSWLRLAL